MTPPPSKPSASSALTSVPNLPPPLPPFPDDPPSMDLHVSNRLLPLPDPPAFADLLDVLDYFTKPDPPITTSRARWNARKAITLSGHTILSVLLNANFATSRTHAARIARLLVRIGGLIPTFRVENTLEIFNSTIHAMYVHRGLTGISDHGLNTIAVHPAKTRPLRHVLIDLYHAFAAICHVAVTLDGHFVHYDQIRGSTGWRRALFLLAQLASADDTDFHQVHNEEKKALFFNLYNLLIFHAKLTFGHPTDLVKRGRFFNSAAYVIAHKRITSVELEHGILRATMRDDDARVDWRLDKKDARMHFILNCGAQSCPPLVPVDPTNVEMIVRESTTKFIENNVLVDEDMRRVTLSRLWKWFRPDFTPASTSDYDLLMWIARQADRDMAVLLSRLLQGECKIKFDVYNWADNGDVNAKPDIRFMSIYDLSFSRSVQ